MIANHLTNGPKQSSTHRLQGLLLLLQIFLNLQQESEANSGALFRLDENIKGHRLDNNLIRKVTALSSVECNLECLREQCCKSTNYKEFLSCDTRDNCELSHAGASEKPEDLVKEDAYLHYEMLRPDRVLSFCCSSPCHNGGTCNITSSKCNCPAGYSGKTCSQALPPLGRTKEVPGKSCKDIREREKDPPSKEYWVKPRESVDALQVYCDMETEEGGWTLVYRYTFTNYSNFYHSSNAVTPRPDWSARNANVVINLTAPINNSSFGALNFSLWKEVGSKFMIKSNINDWFICKPLRGSLVLERDGSISCKNIKNVVTVCNGTTPANDIEWDSFGPLIKARNSIYRFEGSTSSGFPTHDPCDGTNRRNHKAGVQNPAGEIYLR